MQSKLAFEKVGTLADLKSSAVCPEAIGELFVLNPERDSDAADYRLLAGVMNHSTTGEFMIWVAPKRFLSSCVAAAKNSTIYRAHADTELFKIAGTIQ